MSTAAICCRNENRRVGTSRDKDGHGLRWVERTSNKYLHMETEEKREKDACLKILGDINDSALLSFFFFGCSTLSCLCSNGGCGISDSLVILLE